METLSGSFQRAIPRFEQFRVSFHFLAATEDLRLHGRMDMVLIGWPEDF
jgi:hypothetical protein